MISTLEEITLHQEDLEKIELIGTLCRKLRILYLQNSIIEKSEDLTHMKELSFEPNLRWREGAVLDFLPEEQDPSSSKALVCSYAYFSLSFLLKELRYLNLALNNINAIKGRHNCEFLNKLDLSVYFEDFDTLKKSVDHLKPLQHLRELYMLGNPCQSNWETGFREYVIASLPQLEILGGKEIQ
ncbi:hypothetical protein PI124_g614 [Phytophthora idaei]|nr:hypothetical protein PI125_g673 [Phytophthora idaei]KAG3169429.1 hypothetical protein PI126_g2827 [Phytophthora idaei]KAG3254820.1 hypothetical protein PI124_g614 [Phytophthora idaei]